MTPELAAQIADMRAKAEAATPSLWKDYFEYDDAWPGIEADNFSVIVYATKEDTNQGVQGRSLQEALTNASHIAAACPANLIAVLDGLEGEIARLTARAEAAEARVAELRVMLRDFTTLYDQTWGNTDKTDHDLAEAFEPLAIRAARLLQPATDTGAAG